MTNDEARVNQVIAAYKEFGGVATPLTKAADTAVDEREAPAVLIGEILAPAPSHAALALELLTVIDERRPQVIGQVIEGSAKPTPKL